MADRTPTTEAPPDVLAPAVPNNQPPRAQDNKPDDQNRPSKPASRGFLREHPIKALIGLVVVVAIAIGGFLFWNYSQTFETTDDAFVDGHTNYISPRISGTISNVMVVENQFVKEGQVLAEIDPSDYQVAYERAAADAAKAVAQVPDGKSQRANHCHH